MNAKHEAAPGTASGAEGAYVKISLKEKLGYALGDFSTNIIWTAISTFLAFFYTDVAGISAAAVGTILFVTRFLDGVADLGVGVLVDKTKSRHGKARPWLLWMGIPFGLSVMLLFTAPDLGPTGSIIYAFVTYLIVNLLYSAINIPYGVLNSLMTQEPYERSLINIFRMVLAISGGVMISVATMPVVQMFGGGRQGWIITFVIIGLIAPFLYLITFKTTKERVRPTVVQKEVPLKRGVAALFRNKYWLLIVGYSALIFIAQGLGSALNIYYAQYVLKNAGLVGLLALASLLPIVVGIILSAPLVKKFGKRNTSLIGLAVSLIGALLLFVDPTNLQLVLASIVIKNLGLAPSVAIGNALFADTVEYGEWKTGIRTEGLIFSGGSLASKIGSGLGGAVVGWALAWGGYVSKLEVQPDSAVTAIKILFMYVPIAILAVQILLMLLYKLDQKYPQIVEDLKAIASERDREAGRN
ncbi:sugar transporter family protein [Paenibacillus mucilaginosus 3016]|uniref:Sugar transporter family protein n=1 Tax=Paenibacillus mucilaginosus 3016 TaxID=1116391 RepID=H6NKX8_9BACL|nr:MFS transporter [Paenibacillus mucilaginosus]AFC29284.1 sugar transporter family protein [Paenibacillus mucilaginosus 3016]WFA18008.1 MFS transporter [Paenibacillus mucilaginosus]